MLIVQPVFKFYTNFVVIFIIAYFLSTINIIAQSEINFDSSDSLKYFKTNTERANYFFRLSSNPKYTVKLQKKFAKNAMKEAKKTKNLKLEIETTINYARFISFTNPAQAHIYYEKALKKVEKTNYHELKLLVYNKIGKFYLKWDRFSELTEIIDKANSLAKEKKLDRRIAYFLIATMYVKLKKRKKALFYYNKTLSITEEQLKPSVYSEIGNLHFKLGEYRTARKNYRKGLKIAIKNNNTPNMEYLYDNIGLCYYEEKNYTEALQYQRKSLFYREKSKNVFGRLVIYNNISATYLKLNQLDSALLYSKKGLNIAQEIGSRRHLYSLNKTAGFAYQKQNQAQLAYIHLWSADSIREEMIKTKEENHIKGVLLGVEIEKHQAKLEFLREKYKRRTLTGVILGILLFIVIFSTILLYRSYLNKKKYSEKVQEISNLKSKIFAVLAHDLRSPTNSLKSIILGFEDKSLTQNEFVSLLNILTKDVDTMYLTLNNLLQWSSNQMKGLHIHPEKIGLYKVVEQHRYMLESRLDEKSITLTNKLPKELYIYADLEHVNMIFRNLLSNAVKFSFQNGEITITNKLISKKYVQISISDNGTGISKTNQMKLFQSNKHLTLKGTNGEKGIGLGLLIIKDAIEANKGSIWVESELKKGSVFHFTLPIQQ